ncbi:unnamed protein product, partial [Prorocentrum cordatum]
MGRRRKGVGVERARGADGPSSADSPPHSERLEGNDYIIITNFDYWDHDFKEWLDPTALHFGHSRRVGAERLLNKSRNISFTELYAVMTDEAVMAK